MSRSAPSPSSARRVVAALLLAHLLALLALAACPRLHHWVHPDADDDDHDCAVVWLLHGGNGVAPGPTQIPAVVEVGVTVCLLTPPDDFVPSIFAASRVFEHAPPRRG